NKREEIIANTPSEYTHLIENCCSDPNQRPTLNQILIKLEDLSKETTVEFVTNNKYVKNNQQVMTYSERLEESDDNIYLKDESQILNDIESGDNIYLKDESQILN
ncbi:14951_t:CDS:2, partial [Racocetra persica]